jgi:hypothetical protein
MPSATCRLAANDGDLGTSLSAFAAVAGADDVGVVGRRTPNGK